MSLHFQEQLLEQQQQELELIRIAKLRELEKNKLKFSERKFKGKNIREHSIFYTTVTLAFFSVSAGASILFLVPLYVGKLAKTGLTTYDYLKYLKPTLISRSGVVNTCRRFY